LSLKRFGFVANVSREVVTYSRQIKKDVGEFAEGFLLEAWQQWEMGFVQKGGKGRPDCLIL